MHKSHPVFKDLRQCAEAIGARHGMDPADPALRRFSSHVSATLNGLAKRERVRRVLSSDGSKNLWEIAA